MNDILKLNSVTVTTDSDGYTIETKTQKEVFCDVKSAGENEYFKSLNAGYEMALVFIIWKADYSGEKSLEYDSKQYKMQRTFELKDRDMIELHCSTLGA